MSNVSGDHLDLQGLHTLPGLAEVKSVICRVTGPSGTVVLNADDPLVAAVGARVRATVVLFSERNRGPPLPPHFPPPAHPRRPAGRGGGRGGGGEGGAVQRAQPWTPAAPPLGPRRPRLRPRRGLGGR